MNIARKITSSKNWSFKIPISSKWIDAIKWSLVLSFWITLACVLFCLGMHRLSNGQNPIDWVWAREAICWWAGFWFSVCLPIVRWCP